MLKVSKLKFHGLQKCLVVVVFFPLLYVVLLRSSLLRDEAKETFIASYDHRSEKDDNSEELVLMGSNRTDVEKKIPSFNSGIPKDASAVLVNIAAGEVEGWRTVEVKLQKVSEQLQWNQLFPEWIDEEEVKETPSCPDIPMPNFSDYDEVDAVVARLPCRYPDAGWARDVFRLQVHLIAANLAARRARRDGDDRVKLIFQSQCQPMMEIFRIKELVEKEGDWWFYRSDARRLQQMVSVPVGSCRLVNRPSLGSLDEDSHFRSTDSHGQREAYATVIHSSEVYVCGAIVLAHSIRRSGSTRDLVLLHDKTISGSMLRALAAAGWKTRIIERIRNPRAKIDAYNEYNYSKLRLWQLTEYDKVIFVDADALVLLNIDHLFRLPELSATGNDKNRFNSGVMVIEPSNATFSALMSKRDEIVSYNGGDQGFLNEAFVWWHRLSHRVNYLKIFWSNTSEERLQKDRLFGADPPVLNVVHYLGKKPWLCHREYDCNWNIRGGSVYASNEAHRVWWHLHDAAPPMLKSFCDLPKGRNSGVEKKRAAPKSSGNTEGLRRIRVVRHRRRLKP